jgi:uncharacterized protein with GYD domain
MARYLIQATYTAEARKAFASSPQDRGAAIRGLIEKLEGETECIYFSLGDYDAVVIAELADDVTAVAAAIAASAPGHLSAYKTTKLLTNEEMTEAMRKAGKVSFEGPSTR